MGLGHWYNENVVPRFIRCACSAPGIMGIRAQVVPLASGAVFEIGCGGGINQALYDDSRVTSIAGIDPSAKGLEFAQAAAAKRHRAVCFKAASGESIPYDDVRFDSAVCTFTLCSVQSPAATLAELYRILKPRGRLLFAEHGRAPDSGVQAWQDRINPLWQRLAGGCQITRPITPAMVDAGFAVQRLGAKYLEKTPRIAGWFEWGVATKPG